MSRLNTKTLAIMALMIAIEIILTRVLSIQTPTVRISFGFLPIALLAVMYGPLYAGIAAAIADFMGVMLFPVAGFFPGFTLTAFLMGITYGIFLYNHPKKMTRILVAVLIVVVILQLGLDTFWLSIIMDQGVLGLLPGRLLRTAIMIPAQIICIRFVVHTLAVRLIDVN